MKKQKVLYMLTVQDVLNISEEEKIPFNEGDLPLIKEKIGDYLGDKWRDAIEYALTEAKKR